jgi:hypothetical protein
MQSKVRDSDSALIWTLGPVCLNAAVVVTAGGDDPSAANSLLAIEPSDAKDRIYGTRQLAPKSIAVRG